MTSYTSQDEIIAAAVLQGTNPKLYYKLATTVPATSRLHSFWQMPGIPGVGVQDVVGPSGSTLISPVAGQMFYDEPGAGQNNYLARVIHQANFGGMLFICDRLWQNSGLNMLSTSSQGIGSPTWPARDMDGATLGRGVHVGLEITATATGISPVAATIGYTNSNGDILRSGTLTGSPTIQAGPVGTVVLFALQADDVGVQSIDSVRLTPAFTGTTAGSLFAFRVIQALDCGGSAMPTLLDPVTGLLPVVYKGSVPFVLWQPTTASAPTISLTTTMLKG